jgi:hypothetical protein
MKANLYVGLFSMLFSVNAMSQTYFIRHNNSFCVSKYSEAYTIPDNSLRYVHSSGLTDSVVKIYDAFSKFRLGIKAGASVPAGEYASGGDMGGYAELGYSVGIKLLYDMGLLFIVDLTFTSNPFEVSYNSTCVIKEDSYRSYWSLFGIGVPLKLSPDMKIIGSLQIGPVLSRRPEIWVDNWRDKSVRWQPREVTALGYGADVSFLMENHYSTGLKCLFVQSEYIPETDAKGVIRPAVMIISVYFEFQF